MDKVAKKNIKSVEELISWDMYAAGALNEFTKKLIELQMNMDDDVCIIDVTLLFKCSNAESFIDFKKNIMKMLQKHELDYAIDTRKQSDKIGRFVDIDNLYLSLDTIKYLILFCDKNNENINQIKKYFIMVEHRVLSYLVQNQKLDYSIRCDKQRKFPRQISQGWCYFYVIRVTNATAHAREQDTEEQGPINVFKYGITHEIEPRLRSYDVGRLYKAQFHYSVDVPNCKAFEKEFARVMARYHIFERKEFIKVNEDFLVEKLRIMLGQINSN